MGNGAHVPAAVTGGARGSKLICATVAVGVLAAVLVYAVAESPAMAAASYLGVLVAAGVGAWIGAERAPRGQRLVPRLIAVGVSLSALGDVLWFALEVAGADTDVSIADAPWFTSYVILCAALWIVLGRARRRNRGRVDVDYVIDAVTIVVVSMLIFWSFSIDPIVADDSVTPLVRAVWAAYPVADAILLALVIRVLLSRNARAVIGASFGVGVCLWLAADLTYLHAAENAGAQLMADAAWMLAPVLVARAAWRAGRAGPVVPDSAERGSAVPLIVVAVGPLLVPPALELVADLRGEPDRPVQLFVGTGVLIALAFVRTARLVHSERHARRELEVARDAALDASRAKSMFLANVSHEIRTPLTTMLATAELLEDTPLDAQQLTLLERQQRSGELLRKLVEGILDFSRIEAGQLELTSVEFDLQLVVADVAAAHLPRATQTGVRFRYEVDPRLPRTVVGDPGRLSQVLANILDNALKFTHEGHIEMLVRPATSDGTPGAGEHIEFVVSDTGIGIGRADQASVFESFSQVDGSTTRRYGGTGLGLAICHQLTALMGGSITLHSELGAGSTFVVRLPLSGPDQARSTFSIALPLASSSTSLSR